MADHPPLPDRVRLPRGIAAAEMPPEGCFRIRFEPVTAGQQGQQIPTEQRKIRFPCEGTLRVQHDGQAPGPALIASGDLYRRPFCPAETPAEIPVYPAGLYRFYLALNELRWDGELVLGCLLWSFNDVHRAWNHEGCLAAALAPVGNNVSRWAGPVKNSEGTALGRIELDWVSRHLRRAVIEIDTVDNVEPPLDNGAGVDWKALFAELGWKIDIRVSDREVPAPPGGIWEMSDMHAVMLKRRSRVDLDREWRYHLFCVEQCREGFWGHMYDPDREGAVIVSREELSENPFGRYFRDRQVGRLPNIYFWVAVHETGHLMGLHHPGNGAGDHLMANLQDVERAGSADPQRPLPPAVRFPGNIQWHYSPGDQRRLRHRSDLWVRPGGVFYDDTKTS